MATALVLLFKARQARQCRQNAVATQGHAHQRRSIATARVMLSKEPQARWYIKNTVSPQGSAQKRLSIVSAGILSFRGHTQGGIHRTRCLHKAVHKKGGL